MLYGLSESYLGINFRPLDLPDDVAYTLIHNMCYFVFIKVDDGDDTVCGRCGTVGEGTTMYLMFTKPKVTALSGTKVRTAVTSFLSTGAFRGTSPESAIWCANVDESMYAQLLCGLVRRDEVVCVGAIFATVILRAVTFLERIWRELCRDISAGEARHGVLSDPAGRDAVNAIVARPDPELADAIAAECSAPSWRRIVRRLWPRAKYIEAIVTGSMVQCVPMLEFYGGGLPLVSTLYGSSESYLGINLRPLDPPDDVAYTLIHNMCYFELIVTTYLHRYRHRQRRRGARPV
uniref:Uncharacterized protein n=1 Tax=Leersia perrieri TaxID=77586 RepID=A0A0D9XSM1_9ORYZ